MRRFSWMTAAVLLLGLLVASCTKDEIKTDAGKAEKKADEPKAATSAAVPSAKANAPAEAQVAAPVEAAAKPASPVAEPEKEAPLTANALLDQAIEAVGGLDKLKEKLSAYNYKSTGNYFGSPYAMETTWKAPDKMLMGMEAGATVMGYVGSECWTRMGDVVLDCPNEEKTAAAEMLTVAQWTSLYPLKDEGVKLELLEAITHNGKKVLPLKATKVDGGFSAVIYIEEATKLPLGVKYDGHFMGKRGTLETWILEMKEIEGVKVPFKSVMTFDGKTIIEDNVQQMVFGAIDDTAFAKPQTQVGVARVRTLPERLVATTLHKGPYQTMGMTIGMLYGWMGQSGITPMGVPVQVYLTDPSNEQDPAKYVTEVWIQVAKPEKEPAADPARALKTLPAQEIVVQAEIGPYEKAAEGYGKLKAWTEANGYEIAGPAGMFSYSNPMDTPPERLVNEVFFPVRKK